MRILCNSTTRQGEKELHNDRNEIQTVAVRHTTTTSYSWQSSLAQTTQKVQHLLPRALSSALGLGISSLVAGLVGLETWLLVVLVAACALVSNKNEILRNNTTPQAGLLAGRCLPTWPISLKPVGGGGGAGVGVGVGFAAESR